MATISSRPYPVLLEQRLIALGSRITAARKLRSLTQADLASIADVGISTVASLEAGHHGVSVGNLLKVLNAMDRIEDVENWVRKGNDPALIQQAEADPPAR